MVVAVVRCPPQWALLDGRGATHSHQELHHTPHLVTAVGEVAVVPRGDEEHAREVQTRAENQVAGVKPRNKDEQRGQVKRDKGDVFDPSNLLVWVSRIGRAHRIGPLLGVPACRGQFARQG